MTLSPPKMSNTPSRKYITTITVAVFIVAVALFALLVLIPWRILMAMIVGCHKLVSWCRMKVITFYVQINGANKYYGSPTRVDFFLRLTLYALTGVAWGAALTGWRIAWLWGQALGISLNVVILLTIVCFAHLLMLISVTYLLVLQVSTVPRSYEPPRMRPIASSATLSNSTSNTRRES